MNSSRPPIVVGVGEILWDCVGERRTPGGAPANVVFHAGRLGADARLCSRVGTDAAGDELLDLLRGRGLNVSLVSRDAERPTGRVTVDLTDPASPRYTIHEDVAWDAIEPSPALERACATCDALCVGTLAQRSEITRGTILRCLEKAAGAVTVYDVNLRPPFFAREWIEATLDRSRVVKLNEDEARELDAMLEVHAGNTVAFARAMIDRHDVELVCVTYGERGCSLVSAERVHDEQGTPVEVVDSVGAGDAFTAALICGLLRGRDLAKIARSANRLGAAVAACEGAMPDLGELHAEIGRSA